MLIDAIKKEKQDIFLEGKVEGEQIGIQKGEQIGIKKGKIEGLISAIEIGLELKFGSEGLKLLDKIQKINNLDKLTKIKDTIRNHNNLNNISKLLD